MSRRLGVVSLAVVRARRRRFRQLRTPRPRRAWVRPVAGAVVRPFEPPQTRFGAGHLGVDLAAPRGDAGARRRARASVSFAGTVAGSLPRRRRARGRSAHLVLVPRVDPRAPWRRASTRARSSARTGGRGEHHDGRCSTSGCARRHLRRPDGAVPARRPHRGRAPRAHQRAAPSSRRAERAAVALGGPRPRRRRGCRRGRARRRAGRPGGGRPWPPRSFPLPAAVVRGTVRFLSQHCDAHAPPANGEGGSGHRLMLVAGIESSLTGSTSSLGLPTDQARLRVERGHELLVRAGRRRLRGRRHRRPVARSRATARRPAARAPTSRTRTRGRPPRAFTRRCRGRSVSHVDLRLGRSVVPADRHGRHALVAAARRPACYGSRRCRQFADRSPRSRDRRCGAGRVGPPSDAVLGCAGGARSRAQLAAHAEAREGAPAVRGAVHRDRRRDRLDRPGQRCRSRRAPSGRRSSRTRSTRTRGSSPTRLHCKTYAPRSKASRCHAGRS